jgi:hypothetical protein
MKLRPIAFAVLCVLFPVGQASAWLLQPPIDVPDAQAEIDTFQEASATMFDAFADLNAALAEAERNHAPVSLDALSSIRAEIQRAIGLYREAATENLARLPLSIEALLEFSTVLGSSLRADFLPEMTNAADLALAMADIASQIDQTLAILIDTGGISPDDPINIQSREGIAQLSFQMNLFVEVGNAGAAGIGVSMPK